MREIQFVKSARPTEAAWQQVGDSLVLVATEEMIVPPTGAYKIYFANRFDPGKDLIQILNVVAEDVCLLGGEKVSILTQPAGSLMIVTCVFIRQPVIIAKGQPVAQVHFVRPEKFNFTKVPDVSEDKQPAPVCTPVVPGSEPAEQGPLPETGPAPGEPGERPPDAQG